MNRIIINNLTNASDEEAIALVEAVIKQGKISNKGKQYCYVTTFKSGQAVSTDLTKKGSHVFHVYQQNQTEPPTGNDNDNRR